MLQKPKSCSGCPLENFQGGFSIPEGRCITGVLIIGEALGDKEKFYGLPFRPEAEAGSALMTAIRLLGKQREDFAFWNMIACLEADTKVILADNSRRKIVDLVKENFRGEVLSFDENKQSFVNKRVTNTFKNHRNNRVLYRVSYVGAKKASVGVKGIIATEDHKFLTKDGWVETKDLNNKLLNIGPEGYGERAQATIYGTLLGDAGMHDRSATLTIRHCSEQKEWLTCKARVLGRERYIRTVSDNKKHFEVQTQANRYLAKIREVFYVNRIKIVPRVYTISLQALATWYLDNGYICISRQNKKGQDKRRKNPYIQIATCSFTKSDIEILIKALQNYGIDSYIWSSKKKPDHLRLCLGTIATRKFISLIGKYVPPSMRYKLGELPCEDYDSSVWEFEGKKPFHARAIVYPIRSTIEDVYCLEVEDTNNFITNSGVAHNCQPPFNALENTSYEYDAIDHCKVHFNQVINKYKPKVILALGNVPTTHLHLLSQSIKDHIEKLKQSGDKKDLEKYLKNFRNTNIRGYILPSIYNIPMISSFHPSYVTREARVFIWVLKDDLKAAIDFAAGRYKNDYKTKYIEEPTIAEAESFYNSCKSNPSLAISHDIETPYTLLETDETEVEYENIEVRDIDSIQFSIQEGTGIYFPWIPPYIGIAAKILALSNPKVGHNSWGFDKVNIEYHLGSGAIKGLNIDTQWMWKWANQDFVKTGKSLQFVLSFFMRNFPAWKHIAQTEPKKYACHDPNAALIIFNGLYKFFNDPNIFKRTQASYNGEPIKSLWQGFIDDVVELRVILDDVTKRGFPIDPIKREAFKIQIEDEKEKILSELQEEFPISLRRLDPLEGYKRIPAEIIEIEELFKAASTFKNDGPFYIVESPEVYNLRLAQYIEEHTRREKTTGLILKEFTLEGEVVKRWVRMTEFKPNSRNQVVNYLKYKGELAKKTGNKKLVLAYKIPTKRNRKTGDTTDTTSKDELYHMAEKLMELNNPDPFINKVVYSRELDHLAGTYIGRRTENKKTGKIKITGWQPDSDNRLRAKFLFIPASGQLSTSPNIQNAPARGTLFSSTGYEALAKQFRSLVVAAEGKKLLEADYSAFHINTLSFESEDADYNLVGKLDPHSFLAAHIISDYIDMRVLKLKKTKPVKLTDEQWKKRILIGEETIERFKNLDSWLELSDEELRKQLKFIKKNYGFIRNSQAKPALLGLGFGMGVRKFYKLNRHTFKNEVEPTRIHKLVRKLFPKTFVDFPERIKKQADRQTYLISRYGYIRHFYDIFDWRLLEQPRQPRGEEEIIKNSRGQYWCRKPGVDSEACIAYLPSNDAFGKKKEAIRELWQYEKDGLIRNLVQEFGMINEIHDSLMFEVEEAKVEEAASIIKSVMERPAKFLVNSIAPQGLTTAVEVKVGKNWAGFNDDPSKGPINLDGMKDYII